MSLGLALTFSLALQFVLIVRFVWPELLQPALRTVVCFCVAFLWFFFLVRNLARESKRPKLGKPRRADDLFQSAQLEYLKGNWAAVEERLGRLLSGHPDDPEARLLRATLYRRTGQTENAFRELERLSELNAAQCWTEEIERERSLVAAGAPESAVAHRTLTDAEAA